MAIAGQNQVSGAGETQGGPNTVLRVIVEHLLYPITLDILYQVSELRATRCMTAGSFIISSFYIESGRSQYAECNIACNATMNYIHIQVRTRIYVRNGWKFFTSFYTTVVCRGDFFGAFLIGSDSRVPREPCRKIVKTEKKNSPRKLRVCVLPAKGKCVSLP